MTKIIKAPIADGGDGTLDVLAHALQGRLRTTTVRGPLGSRVKAKWGLSGQGHSRIALIEMARASGLALVKGRNKILEATSYGTGQLIRAALNNGCRKIFIGVGGTATADGGAGALEALGLTFLDQRGKKIKSNPLYLMKLAKIDWSTFDKRIKKAKIFVLCDVKNPLLGPSGSAKTFAPQKGATRSQVLTLEKLMRHWSTFSKRHTENKPGAGAAGALAFGLSAFANAKLVQGAPFVMKTIQWKKKAAPSRWIITGEGTVDRTSFSGKAVGAVVQNRANNKVAVICGKSKLNTRELKRRGVHEIVRMGPAGIKNPHGEMRKAVKKLICLPQLSKIIR